MLRKQESKFEFLAFKLKGREKSRSSIIDNRSYRNIAQPIRTKLACIRWSRLLSACSYIRSNIHIDIVDELNHLNTVGRTVRDFVLSLFFWHAVKTVTNGFKVYLEVHSGSSAKTIINRQCLSTYLNKKKSKEQLRISGIRDGSSVSVLFVTAWQRSWCVSG